MSGKWSQQDNDKNKSINSSLWYPLALASGEDLNQSDESSTEMRKKEAEGFSGAKNNVW